MIISDFEAVTLVDYQGVIASVVFTWGCNLRCRFCHNPELVIGSSIDKTSEFLNYIKSAKVDGVSVTGGEPLIHKGLPDFLRLLKSYGLKVKLDTNGTMADRLDTVVSEGLVDYVALDVKGLTDEEIQYVTRRKAALSDFYNSLQILKNSSVAFELRLTVWKAFAHEDIRAFCEKIGDTKLFLQRARSEGLLDKRFSENICGVDFNKVEESFKKYSKIYVR